MYELVPTKRYKKDLKLIENQKKKIADLESVLDKLKNGITLEPKHRDHPLKGNYKGCRECHVDPDLLFIYRIDKGDLVLLAFRVGSHSDLFKK